MVFLFAIGVDGAGEATIDDGTVNMALWIILVKRQSVRSYLYSLLSLCHQVESKNGLHFCLLRLRAAFSNVQ